MALMSRTCGQASGSVARHQAGTMRVRIGVRGFTFVVTACACSMTLMLSSVSAGASDPPSVTPATGGGGKAVIPGFTAFGPAVVGYEQSEVFLSGMASAYQPAAPLGTDGKYSVMEAGSAQYTTRAVVMRPIDPSRFNGTVVVEWL